MKMQIEKLVRKPCELEITGATLLSVDEASTLLTENDRACGSWWWLRSPGFYQNLTAFVRSDSSVDAYGFYVRGGRGGVRPALKIENLVSANLKIRDEFYIGGQRFTIISGHLAFCESTIGHMRFDAMNNDYETSEIKKYVDDWFAETVSKYTKENAK